MSEVVSTHQVNRVGAKDMARGQAECTVGVSWSPAAYEGDEAQPVTRFSFSVIVNPQTVLRINTIEIVPRLL